MNILGISSLDNNSSASLIVDGRIVAAIAEERLSRVKMQDGFPRQAVDEVLRIGGLDEKDIDVLAYPFFPWHEEGRRIASGYLRNTFHEIVNGGAVGSRMRHRVQYGKWCARAILDHRRYGRELNEELRQRGWEGKLQRVEHHLAHAAAAYLTAGVERALIVTLDWYGGGLAGAISIGQPNGISRLKSFHYPHSMGLFYAQVTHALGFKPSRHEGKIVGLAAYGDSSILYNRVRKRFRTENGDLRYLSGMDSQFAAELAKEYPREHVAAVYQKVLEDVVQDVVAYYVKKTGLKTIALAGGVAANVKMNQRMLEIEGVEHVFVHPAMADEGTGTGAALQIAFQQGEARPCELEDVYLGPEYTADELQSAMVSGGLKPRYMEDIEQEVARRIADGKVVAHFDGRMEYGPRALGNRSILYHANDPSVNDWLNKRLRRTEFMPFAPATLIEEMSSSYLNLAGARHTARFMTITCDCTNTMKRTCPAAVHVDGTARPQLVDRHHAPRFYHILTEYKALTGIPTVINTSFNMHEEPIVCTPEDAVRAFNEGALDVLVMGNLLAENDGQIAAPLTAGDNVQRQQRSVAKSI